MRRPKDPEVRKNEILDAAQKLFFEKGYDKTTVTDILNVHGLSKGVFYYYFKSKEEVMDAILQRIADAKAASVKKIVENTEMTPIQKLCTILLGQDQSEELEKDIEDMKDQFHIPENTEIHQKSFVLSIQYLAPIIAEILKEDFGGHTISTNYPRETIALFMAAAHIFDEELFRLSEEERFRYAQAYIEMMEKTLGLPQGALAEVIQIFALGNST